MSDKIVSEHKQRLHDLKSVHSNFRQIKELLCSGATFKECEITEISQELEKSLETLATEISKLDQSPKERKLEAV